MPNFLRDQHRPRYHFLPPEQWMNDPNGIIHWRGRYHMFYQYNPNGSFWGSIHWGHAVSTDLVHWQHLPIALAPTPESVDADGVFSGCAVDNAGTVTLVYSGFVRTMLGFQYPCVATAADADLVTWVKYAGNPVIREAPPGLDVWQFRDHTMWREDDGYWYQAIGAAIRDVGGAALLYRSRDLLEWEYLHPLAVGDMHQREPVWGGTMWECPQFIRLAAAGDQAALLISAWDHATLHTVAMVGRYRDHRFQPEQTYKFDYGDNYFYAPQACIDAGGRTVLWGWLQEGRPTEADQAAGWSGVMSLPRIITARTDGLLGVAPAPELVALRREHIAIPQSSIEGEVALAGSGDTLELAIILQPQASRCGVILRRTPDGSEQTRIVYDRVQATLSIDSTQSSRDKTVTRDIRGGPLVLANDEPLHLRIFLDRSTLEVFANQRACLTGRIYPTRADALGLGLFAEGGAALAWGDLWQLDSIWDEHNHA